MYWMQIVSCEHIVVTETISLYEIVERKQGSPRTETWVIQHKGGAKEEKGLQGLQCSKKTKC
jgi:hypothetical protein